MLCNTQNRLLLQFHITGRCNLCCKHCYRTEGDVETLSLDDVISVIDQFCELVCRYNEIHRIKKRAHINLTGGEPFFRADFDKIIEYIAEKSDLLSYGILSNGSFIDAEMISLLKRTNVSFVQLSIDGNRQTHDSLRAKGDYDRVLATAKMLEKNAIRTYISFTANKENYRHLPKIAKECRKRKITKLWSDRLVPIGNGADMLPLTITADDMSDYINTLKTAQGNIFTKILYPKTQVTMNRALQFIDSDGLMYSCSAGDSLITVDEMGRIMPCRRMPIICGDVFTSTLTDVYFNNQTFIDLRKKCTPNECALCKFKYDCRGGARCQSYAQYNSFRRADPACFLKTGK